MQKLSFLLLLFFTFLTSCQVEQIQRIKRPGDKENKKCRRFIEFDRDFPIEEFYSVIWHDGMLYLVVSHKDYVDDLFQKRFDGFAVDVIKKEQYDCDGPNQLNESWAFNGTLLPPLFKKDFKKGKRNGSKVWIPYRRLPESFDPSNVEFNLLVLNQKWRCDYVSFTSLEKGNWSLLPTGLYRDSIPESTGTISQNLSKTHSFTLFFEQDQAAFDSTLFKPFYDTLNLTDYIIQGISIDAFASVEGSTKRNTELLEQRAQNMVKAMQAYQTEEVASHLTTGENWDDFFDDVIDTPFAQLADLSKTEIKQLLNSDKGLLKRLQPILELHRKAYISVKLEKRYTVDTNDPKKLKAYFEKRVKEKNINEAIFIQNAIFRKIKDNKLPEDFLGEIEIPKAIGNLPLLNNDIIFKRKQEVVGITETLNSFLKLLELKPNSSKIQFNVITIKTRLWSLTKNRTYGFDIDSRLKILEQSDLPPVLVARLRMNYHILLANYLHQARQYERKNLILAKIYNTYRGTRLTDEERLSLAQYLIYYYRYNEASDILRPRARQESASTDVLFQYLNIVMVQPDPKLREAVFMRMMNTAIERDLPRYCKLFDPLPRGGLSFQLLNDPILKERYCEACSGKMP